MFDLVRHACLRGLLMLAAFTINSVAIAAAGTSMGPSFSGVDLREGFYSGIELGRARTSFGLGDATVMGISADSGTVDNKTFFGRLFFGSMFHPNVGGEVSLAGINGVKFSKLMYPGNTDAESAKVNLILIDLVARLVMPVSDQIRFFTRGGLAYIRADSKSKITIGETTGKVLDNLDRFTWVVGVGGTYAWSETTEWYLAWTHYDQSGKVPDLETLGVGIIYHTA